MYIFHIETASVLKSLSAMYQTKTAVSIKYMCVNYYVHVQIRKKEI